MNFVPCGAGISIPECEEEAPPVGDILLPKGELILVYPGIGHTKPSGFKSIISELIKLLELEISNVGIKKVHIKRTKKIMRIKK